MIRITIVVENSVFRQRLLAEHGLAYHIQQDGTHILFDTGQGFALSQNAGELGIELSATDIIALSHGHYDHTGGLCEALTRAPNALLVTHPSAFSGKFRPTDEGGVKDIGMPQSALQSIREHPGTINETTGSQTIAPGIHLTGEIQVKYAFEPLPSNFFTDQALTHHDTIPDDRAMWLETSGGLVILLGCAHRGVINTINTICAEAGTKHIHALLGGMHLAGADQTRIKKTVQLLLNDYKIDHLYPGHCTGLPAQLALHQAFGTACHQLFTGMALDV